MTRTGTGEAQAVRYQELIMLVNELQRRQQELAELSALVGELREGAPQR